MTTIRVRQKSLKTMEKVINWIAEHLPNIGLGVVVAAASKYFQPIKGIVTITIIVIIFDLILGVWAARTRGEGIKSEKLWRTVYKMLISVTLLHLLFSIDTEFGITMPHSYVIVGLFIIGFELWSILENAAVITDHRSFRTLKKYMEDKVKKQTGVDMRDDKDKKKKNGKGTSK